MSELDPVQAALNRAVSRRTLLRRAAVGGAALSTPALLAACDIGGDDNESAGTTTATEAAANQSNLNFYSVTHGESGNVFWAIYRNGIRDARTPVDAASSEVAVEGLTLAV